MKIAKSQTRKSRKTPKHPEWAQKAVMPLLTAALATTPDGMVTINAHGEVVLWNRAAEKMFGYTTDEVIGKPLTIIMPERFQEAHKSSLDRVASGGKPKVIGKTVEMAGLKKDKSEFPLELSLAKWKTGEGVFFTAVIRDITERKQAEEKLRISEKRYRQLLENLQEGVWVIDKDACTTFVNRPMAEMLGYTQNEMLGKHLFSFMDERGVEIANLNLERRKQGIKEQHEFEFIRKNGKRLYAILETSPIVDDDGNYIGALAGVLDITERKQTEEALKENEEKFRSLVESTSDWIWEINLNGVYTYASPKVKELLGYEPEEVIGKTPFDLMPAEEANRVANTFKDIVAASKPIEGLENTCRHKNGHLVVLETSGVPVLDSKGQLRGYRGIDRDITERKQAEEESNFRAQLLDAATDSIFVHDFDGNIIYANEVAYKSRGYTKEEFMKMNIRELAVPEYAVVIEPKLSNFLEAGKAVFEFAHFRKDKSIMPMEIQSQIIEPGGRKLVLGIARDISERKKMQDSLIITDRLAALGNMAGGFAHELNNPLTSVIGYAQLLLDRKDLPEDVRRDLTGIYEEAQRASEVIKEFMAFALKQPQPKQLFDINDLIKDVLKLRKYAQRNNNIIVKTNFDPDLPLVTVGPVRMRQVFMDIITNAEYFMFEAHEKGTLTITTEKAGEVVRASFTDDGPGIPPENLGQIFNPFFTTKEVGQGIGLGLSICHGIVIEHGGKIYVESELDKGSTFVVELPISQE
jgi:PAS domain S-box-containing protein